MLYDPKWESETKTEEPSVAGLIIWLEKQDPNEKYEWASHRCLIGRYLESLGHEDLFVNRSLYMRLTTPDCIAIEAPQTFGAALDRARAAYAKGFR